MILLSSLIEEYEDTNTCIGIQPVYIMTFNVVHMCMYIQYTLVITYMAIYTVILLYRCRISKGSQTTK